MIVQNHTLLNNMSISGAIMRLTRATTMCYIVLHTIFISLSFTTHLYAAKYSEYHDRLLVRDVQRILARSDFYHGNIDGICKSQTAQAIDAYTMTLPQKPQGEPCTLAVAVLRTVMVSTTAVTHPANDNAIISALSSKIDSLTNDVNKTKSQLSKIETDIYKAQSGKCNIKYTISANYITE
jgi:hypothetical protein